MLNCDAVPTETSVSILEITTGELTLQNYPELRQVGQVFIILCWSAIRSWLALEGGMILMKQFSSAKGDPERRLAAKSCLSTALQQLGG